MKKLLIVALMLCATTFATGAYAQADFLPDTQDDQEETIFSKASDKQLAEAENFYKSCSNNPTMNDHKDCKCAATEYLETRMEMGDDAAANQIMMHNISKCLKEKNNLVVETVDLSKVTDEQLDEANKVYESCKLNIKLSRFYDCECYAARFLDGRIKQGPIASKELIIMSFYNECRNTVEATGYEYTRCMKDTEYRPIENIVSKKYCECYARKWGELFESHKGNINMKSKRRMRLNSMAHCKRPGSYK